jgi:putative transposase
VYVPSTGWVRIGKSREALGELGSLTGSQAADGHWYCSLTETIIQQGLPVPRLRPERIVGFDAGLRHLLVAHDGWRVPCPRWFRQAERKLRQANKALSRSQQGS